MTADNGAPASHVSRGRWRGELVEDIADLLEADPGFTLEGLALRLGRSRDSITLALRRAARIDGDARAIAIRARLLEPRRDIAS